MRRTRSAKTAKRARSVPRQSVHRASRAAWKDIDALEQLTPTCLWPVPAYVDMLFDL